MIKKHIPNLLTSGNLFCGCIAIVEAFNGNLHISAYLVGLAAIFDFLDGFAARLLNVSGELGKQLDSLADMVTSGVVPGIIVYNLLQENSLNLLEKASTTLKLASFNTGYLPYFGLYLKS